MKISIASNKENILKKHSNLTEIFNEKNNISIWKRKLNSELINASNHILNEIPELQISEVVKNEDVETMLVDKFGENENILCLIEDISRVVKLFCDLFNINQVWLRLDAIDSPMCPRFHTDNLKCRLVTTYKGPATQWLPNDLVNRDMLGHGNDGKPDEESGLFLKNTDIEELDVGHVALLKGEGWIGNEGKGLVHRSPHKENNYKRLYMTIDFTELYLKIFQNRLNVL